MICPLVLPKRFMPLEMEFCYAAELGRFDLMGWACLALLCDYALRM